MSNHKKNIYFLVTGKKEEGNSFGLDSNEYSLEISGSAKNTLVNCSELKDVYKCSILAYGSRSKNTKQIDSINIIPINPLINKSISSISLIKFLISNPDINKTQTIIFTFNRFISAFLIKILKPKLKVIICQEGDFKHAIWSPYINNILLRFGYFLISGFGLMLADRITVDKRVNWLLLHSPKFLKKKTAYLPNEVDRETFFPEKHEPKNEFRLLYVGRLDFEPQKNPALLFKAFEYVTKKIPNITLTIIGSNEDKIKEIFKKHSINNSNKIILKGTLKNNEIANYYRESDLTLLTSKFEGTPHVILESLSCGTPCISTNVIESNLIQDAVNGYICNSFDPKEFSELILKGLALSKKTKLNPQVLLPNKYLQTNRKEKLISLIEN